MDAVHTLSDDLEAALVRLRERAPVWAALPPAERAALLLACRERVAGHADAWTAAAAEIKGVAGTPASGEEAITGPWGVIRALDAYIETLAHVGSLGRPLISQRLGRRAEGAYAVRVFPNSLFDRFLLPGVTADVWLQSGAAPDDNCVERGGHVVAVMGAGNITAIAILDVLTKLVNDDAVCMLKIHSRFDPLAPIMNDAFAPLIEAGYLATTCGGSDRAALLCSSPLVDAVHVTGSAATYRAIAAKSAKPITAELGNVTPAIVLAGRWSDADIEYAAESIVSAKLHNNGYNCAALQVLVLPSRWEQGNALLAAIERVMQRVPRRQAYYTGSIERFQRLIAGRTTLRQFGDVDDNYIPPSVVEVDAADAAEPLFAEEAFCPLLAVTTIEGESSIYLRDAVRFCNEALAGDLAAHIIAHPAALRDSAADVDDAIQDLRYGCVGINLWCGAAFLIPQIPWGGAAGNSPNQVRSGIGSVHNSLRIMGSTKTVLRGPLRPLGGRFRPPWFATQRNAAAIGKTLSDYERTASLTKLARIAWLTLPNR
jgi:acyl-CoA reductase-like NAD-dependent aldehyde dehydrogenase